MNGVEQKFNFVYDNGGRRERLKSFNGVSLVTETTYGFDNASRLLEMKHLNPLSQILEQVNYAYDPNGNRTSMQRPSVNLTMPNQVSNTSYNEANHMLSFNDKNITYDNNGNMTSVTNSCGTTNYTWDVRNRLTGISGFKPDCTSLTASFKYDVLNRRIEKTINSTTTKYLYDGLDIIQELNQDGSLKANYIRGLNIDEPLARIKADGTIRYYQTDALGSVIALTDENGIVKTTYSYDPFGNVTVSGETSDNPFQFAGRENDGTGLYYYRARYYSPELQRFISEDPIGFGGGDVNLYVMVGNNPVNFVDPLGLEVTIRIQRDILTRSSISGIINVSSDQINDTFRGYTLEPIRAKGPVPIGTYDAFLRKDYDPWRIQLSNVPSNKGIQIHVGNRPRESTGCFLVGSERSTDYVGDSRTGMKQILDIIQKDKSGIIKVIVE